MPDEIDSHLQDPYQGTLETGYQLGDDIMAQNLLQTYAFNYITSGETSMNMNSFDSNLYFLEMINLTGDSITEQVSDFINARR